MPAAGSPRAITPPLPPEGQKTKFAARAAFGLFEGGAGLAPNPVRSLENVDRQGEGSRLQRDTVRVRLPVLHDPLARRPQLLFADPGRDDFGRKGIAHSPENLGN